MFGTLALKTQSGPSTESLSVLCRLFYATLVMSKTAVCDSHAASNAILETGFSNRPFASAAPLIVAAPQRAERIAAQVGAGSWAPVLWGVLLGSVDRRVAGRAARLMGDRGLFAGR